MTETSLSLNGCYIREILHWDPCRISVLVFFSLSSMLCNLTETYLVKSQSIRPSHTLSDNKMISKLTAYLKHTQHLTIPYGAHLEHTEISHGRFISDGSSKWHITHASFRSAHHELSTEANTIHSVYKLLYTARPSYMLTKKIAACCFSSTFQVSRNPCAV